MLIFQINLHDPGEFLRASLNTCHLTPRALIDSFFLKHQLHTRKHSRSPEFPTSPSLFKQKFLWEYVSCNIHDFPISSLQPHNQQEGGEIFQLDTPQRFPSEHHLWRCFHHPLLETSFFVRTVTGKCPFPSRFLPRLPSSLWVCLVMMTAPASRRVVHFQFFLWRIKEG